MNDRENMISLARRKGFERIPVIFSACPTLKEKLNEYIKTHDFEIPEYVVDLNGPVVDRPDDDFFMKNYYQDITFKPGTKITAWGIAHEPGSKYAYHMTKMYHPLENADSVEEIEQYPFPVQKTEEGLKLLREGVEAAHARGKFAMGQMQMTIWEKSWYLRGMENLMCDMMLEDEKAAALLDRVTAWSVGQAVTYAKAGCDGIFLGDDVGMQHTIMLSRQLYSTWLQPRLKKVIDAAKAVKPDLIVFYHSCGHVTELIPNLMEAGIDVLNPVQPESMNFEEVYKEFGDRRSFHGTIGTQTVMPFGTPEEVRKNVFHNLDIVGRRGGLFVCPTHLLEPEVPVENVIAYIQACKDYTT